MDTQDRDRVRRRGRNRQDNDDASLGSSSLTFPQFPSGMNASNSSPFTSPYRQLQLQQLQLQQQQQQQQQHQQQQHQQQQQHKQQQYADWDASVARQLGQYLFGIMSYLWETIIGCFLVLRPIFSLVLAVVVVFLIVVALGRGIFASVCKVPLVPMMLPCPAVAATDTFQVPDFAGVIDDNASALLTLLNSMNNLNPAFIPKKIKNKIKSKGQRLFGRKSKEGGAAAGTRSITTTKTATTTATSHADGGQQYYYGEGFGQPDMNDNYDIPEDSGYSGSEDEMEEDDPYGLNVHARVGGLPLPLLLKRSEMAVVDLKVVVKHSSLPDQSKEMLVQLLEVFHSRAGATARNMQFLQSRANGCVDGLVVRNRYLIAELDRLEKQLEKKNGMWDMVSDFFSGTNEIQVKAERKLEQLYKSTMDESRKHVQDLILRSKEVLEGLDTLDQTLGTINDLITQENRQQKTANDEILAQLWTILGGNQVEREQYRENLELLQSMDVQRKAIFGQIEGALYKLTNFEADMGVLREKIFSASVGATFEDEYQHHHQTVKAPKEGEGERVGADSFRAGQASMLKVHIQQIELVTQRLKARSFLADTMNSGQTGTAGQGRGERLG
ncbi:hypothetical protein BX616_003765 [Lobosporangium transversale]|nr:hypothetical protein BX616_003765 [Lobosporangium transversale]